jgi:predicted polyphosphate/ATP-dependent NAD kinase
MESKYIVKTKDKIVQDIIEKIDRRSEVGMKKYGKAMIDEVLNGEKDLRAFMIDVQEELMDALLYLEAAKHCLHLDIEDAVLQRLHEESPYSEKCNE